jgi:hypothetical protein
MQLGCSGVVFCAHPDAHRAAMGIRAGYLIHGPDGERDPLDYNPAFSRRSRRRGPGGCRDPPHPR